MVSMVMLRLFFVQQIRVEKWTIASGQFSICLIGYLLIEWYNNLLCSRIVFMYEIFKIADMDFYSCSLLALSYNYPASQNPFGLYKASKKLLILDAFWS